MTNQEENNENENQKLIEQFERLVEKSKYNALMVEHYESKFKRAVEELEQLKKTATLPVPVYQFNVN